ncbi:protein RGF1 INDUCIBLE TRANSCRIPTION FACTOR 1 [Physcomitrium patens]|uniref:PLATZ transcription factor family protein n=1 Tax=Physcomitrium patens TaxID=3218 RepID=A0A2K1JE82_PHYPA|nr:uncharacterized protein LOC112292668 [Physcomitrium patens]PNR39845.1 hypothetical protein PHYPA_020125 [Physcomitrium patens]|eukprot:XP_024397161.1 uncharacterized protein LOC112292668 [Physcomitrella patens]
MVMGGTFMNREGPSWLPALVKCDDFFSHCNHHTSGKNERNQFCFDCPQEGPLCPEELTVSHRGLGHATIQIRRASHRDVVRIADIQKYVDLTNIQPYTINSAKIVFLQSKPQPKIVKGAAHYCERCQRSIADPVRFCSISCKLEGIQLDPHDFTLTLTVFSKSGPGFFSKGGTDNVGAASPEHSVHSHGSGVTDFSPETPKKISKRSLKETPSPFSKKAKSALSAAPVFGLLVHLPRDDGMGLTLTSPMAPPTPTYESGPKVHHRKQVRPHRAPMF